MLVYYRWWPNGNPGDPELALDEPRALRHIRKHYPDAVLSEWVEATGDLQEAADDQRLVWANARAREEDDTPVADLLRVW